MTKSNKAGRHYIGMTLAALMILTPHQAAARNGDRPIRGGDAQVEQDVHHDALTTLADKFLKVVSEAPRNVRKKVNEVKKGLRKIHEDAWGDINNNIEDEQDWD